MFSREQRLKAAVYLWHLITDGDPMTVREASDEWDKWARANVGIARRSRQWLYLMVPKAIHAGYMEQVEAQGKRYRVVKREESKDDG